MTDRDVLTPAEAWMLKGWRNRARPGRAVRGPMKYTCSGSGFNQILIFLSYRSAVLVDRRRIEPDTGPSSATGSGVDDQLAERPAIQQVIKGLRSLLEAVGFTYMRLNTAFTEHFNNF